MDGELEQPEPVPFHFSCSSIMDHPRPHELEQLTPKKFDLTQKQTLLCDCASSALWQLDIENENVSGVPFDGRDSLLTQGAPDQHQFPTLRRLDHFIDVDDSDGVSLLTQGAPGQHQFPTLRRLDHFIDVDDSDGVSLLTQGAPDQHQFPTLRRLDHFIDVEDFDGSSLLTTRGATDQHQFPTLRPPNRVIDVENSEVGLLVTRGATKQNQIRVNSSKAVFRPCKSRKTQTHLSFDGHRPCSQIGVLYPSEPGTESMSFEEKSALITARMMANAWSEDEKQI